MGISSATMGGLRQESLELHNNALSNNDSAARAFAAAGASSGVLQGLINLRGLDLNDQKLCMVVAQALDAGWWASRSCVLRA